MQSQQNRILFPKLILKQIDSNYATAEKYIPECQTDMAIMIRLMIDCLTIQFWQLYDIVKTCDFLPHFLKLMIDRFRGI